MKMRHTIEDLKDDVPMESLLLHIGAVPVNTGWGGDWAEVHCPFHDDREASASYNKVTGYFVCHACGAPRDGMAGDIVDVAKAWLQTDSITEAIHWLREEVA